MDAGLGYVLPIIKRRLRLSVQANNLFNDHSIIFFNGTSASTSGSLPLYFVNASRSVFFSLSATL